MVDLIPAEYHRSQRVKRLLHRFGWASLGIAVVAGLAGTGLAYAISGERTALARYKHMQALARTQQARLAEVTARRDDARKQLQALDSLRGGTAIGRLVDGVDAALNDRIWFQEVAFSRDSLPAERRADAGGSTQAVAAPKGTPVSERSEDGKGQAGAHAEIHGIARDHAALSEFMTQLGSRPGVAQVRLIDTSARSYPGVQVVDFRLTLLLETAKEAAR